MRWWAMSFTMQMLAASLLSILLNATLVRSAPKWIGATCELISESSTSPV